MLHKKKYTWDWLTIATRFSLYSLINTSVHASVRQLWIVIPFSIISGLIHIENGVQIDALNAIDIKISPIASLSGSSLEFIGPIAVLQWLLIFFLFLLIVGDTAVQSLWQQHVMLLPRLRKRQYWWLSQVTAVVGLSFIYMFIYLVVAFLIAFLIGRTPIRLQDIFFYGQIFILYSSTLAFLGCGQLLLLLFTRSRSQTLFLILGFIISMSYVGGSFPNLLAWLPVTQTSFLAQLLQNGTIDGIGLMIRSLFLLVLCTLVGLLVIRHYEFMGHLKHD